MDRFKMVMPAFYAAATVCQFAALVFTVGMFKGKGDRRPWAMLFVALLLMLLFRLQGIMRGGAAPSQLMQMFSSVGAFGISVFLFIALFYIRHLSVVSRQSQAIAEKRAIERDDALARLDAAMHAGQVGTWVWDIQADQVFADEHLARMFGVSSQDARGGNRAAYVAAMHPEDRARAGDGQRDIFAAGASDFEAEYRLRSQGSANDAWRWVSIRGRLERDGLGKPARMIGVAVDVHEKKLAAEALVRLLADEKAARREAEIANRVKDEFLATLSHELRTPLNAIVGWAHLLKEARDPETVEEGMTVIERNSRSLTQLISDLLDMSRIISGKLRLEVDAVELNSVIDAALQTVTPAASAREIRIEKVVESKAIAVTGDAARLQQVMWNLLSNAIKFTPKGGCVRVELRALDSSAEICVSDNGPGMSPDFLPHVFERFRQADATTTRVHGGLGLGLAIVKHLVELHGGSVSASSDGIGRGSAFLVRLPIPASLSGSGSDSAGRADAPNFPRTPRSTRILRGLKVLVVDDEADARDLIRRMLEDSDAVVSTAASGAEALSLSAQEKPDVLVSDIGMPGMDGYELIQQMRNFKMPNGERIPAIALTAFARSEDRTRALLAGYVMHVSKPVEPSELVASIASVAGRTTRGTTNSS